MKERGIFLFWICFCHFLVFLTTFGPHHFWSSGQFVAHLFLGHGQPYDGPPLPKTCARSPVVVWVCRCCVVLCRVVVCRCGVFKIFVGASPPAGPLSRLHPFRWTPLRRTAQNGFHTTARELHTCTFEGPAFNHTTNATKRLEIVAGEEKKSAKFCPPPHPHLFGAPTGVGTKKRHGTKKRKRDKISNRLSGQNERIASGTKKHGSEWTIVSQKA